MLTAYQIFKSLHIVGFVSWFAGMFFLVRLFVNHVEALAKTEPERSILDASFRGMEGRVYRIIMTPAMVFTFICGFSMVGLGTKLGLDWLFQNWFQAKLLFLAALLGYHFWCKKILEKMERGEKTFDSFQYAKSVGHHFWFGRFCGFNVFWCVEISSETRQIIDFFARNHIQNLLVSTASTHHFKLKKR
jgi:uncharacterized integral membrane protein (TIGR00701 family)